MFRGGNRSGKTTSGSVETGWWATGQHPYLKTPSHPRILMVANDWSQIGSPMWEKLSQRGGVKLKGKGRDSAPIIPKRMIKEIAWESKAEEIPNLIVLTNGTRITCRSAQSGRVKFQGTEYDLVWIDEELEDYSVYEEIRRSMIDRGGKLIWTATPLARARPLIALHEAASDATSEMSVEEFVASMLDNPHVSEKAKKEFIGELLREHPEYYETRVSGEFLIMEGLVYAMYKTRVHEMSRAEFDTMDPDNKHARVIAIDPGLADPFAILWGMLLPGDKRRVILYREFYRRRTTIKEAVAHVIRESRGEPLVRAIIDPSAKKHDAKGGDSVFEDIRKEFREQGLRSATTGGPLPIDFGVNEIVAGIYRVQEFLAAGHDDDPGIRIVSDMENFKREIHRYMYPLGRPNKNVPKKPIDKDNHLMDDMRYMIMGLPPYQAVKAQHSAAYNAYLKWRRYNEQQKVKQSITLGGR